MKKILILATAALMICGSAMAQQDTTAKKKGGFMKALKKGVESSTGLRVSDEALFVYPNLAEWKFAVVSCVGDLQTGTVNTTISCTLLLSERDAERNVWCIMREAKVTGGQELKIQYRNSDPFFDFIKNKPTVVEMEKITGVPTDTKTIDIKFTIQSKDRVFEGRRIPIEWK